MTALFWIPFATGVLHQMGIQQKKEKQWSTTISILGTTSVYTTLTSIRNEYFLKPEFQKTIPSKVSVPAFLAMSFTISAIHHGAFFCIGHLLTKKAYPAFEDK
jgi:hypothetical protein